MNDSCKDFLYPVETKFSAADPDPLREMERHSLARLRFVACHKLPGLEKHLEGTALLALEIAKHLGLSEREKENLWYAASLHDIGKIGIDPLILTKEGSLSHEEFREIQAHTTYGEMILSGVDGEIYRCCSDVALSHHEQWDGKGYPHGLSGEQISLLSRIVAVADAYDCMTEGRPYQVAQTNESADVELERCTGTQFDPELAELFRTKIRPV